ncbi:universal stress protein [Actinoplanes sp. NPDC024001]|uniref:universal stress protein n=1 Tax=Actinoplanes sp. NPDC024001 TaxID=3154598 RepID=UPI0033E2A5E3
MFATIAWATDTSQSDGDALPVVESLARGTGANVVIVHVQEVVISRSGFVAEDSTAASTVLHRAVRRLREQDIEATVLSTAAAARDVPQRILTLTESAGASVLVVGNRRQGAVLDLLLGSVSARLLKAARLPVLLVPIGPGQVTDDAVTGPVRGGTDQH